MTDRTVRVTLLANLAAARSQVTDFATRVEALTKNTHKVKIVVDLKDAQASVQKFGADLKKSLSFGGSGGSGSSGDSGVLGSYISSTLFGKTGGIAAGIASGLAAVPALFAATGAAAGIAFGAKLLIGSKASQGPLYKSFTELTNNITKVMKGAVTPLIAPLKSAFSQLGSFFKQIGPQIKSVFSALGPLVQPLIYGLEGLVGGILPGFITLMKAAQPAVQALAFLLGSLGDSFGQMFSIMAPAVAASSVIFQALGSFLNALLPALGAIASIMAKALGPAMSALLGAFDSLMPAISIVAGVLAKFAGAVLTSLTSSLALLAGLFKAIAPGVTIFARALGQVFNILENSGVAFVLADALAEIIKPLGQVVNSLLRGLAPVLPLIIGMFAKFVTLLAGETATAITEFLRLLVPLIPALVEVVTWITKLVAGALRPMLPVLAGAVIAWKLLTVAMELNPWVALGVAIVVVAAIIVKYHTQIWAFVVRIWTDIKNFLVTIWNQILAFVKNWGQDFLVLFGPAGFIAAVVINIIKYHRQILAFIETIWNAVSAFVSHIWGNILSFAKAWWPLLLGPAGIVAKYHNQILAFIRNIWNTVVVVIRGYWNTIYADARAIWSTIVNYFSGIPHRMIQALSGLGNDLNSFAKQAINLFLEGLKSDVGNILGWVASFAKGIVNVFKKIWGWFSPSSVMYEGGRSLMQGLAQGIKAHAKDAVKVASSVAGQVAGSITGGVQRWSGIVSKALSMLGLPQSLSARVLYQMQTESGGNPNAINLTDINAQMGDPSRGLLQVIATTFKEFHVPGTSSNIYDPLANVAAAISYARAVYGPTLMSNGSGMGSGHGYRFGGIITEPIWGIGKSGQSYTFGEAGHELVTPLSGQSHARASAGGTMHVYNINVQPGPMAHPADIGREVVTVIKQFEKRSGTSWRS